MSDRMTPIPFGQLMNHVLCEHPSGSVFGVHAPYVAPQETGAKKLLSLFSERLETPFGPAAGPHTQLAQNIIAAYYAGCRFFELKTVQTLDGEDLPVSKPCILAEDECYNVEWSTELTVGQAFQEYVKAWFALKLISREYGLGCADGFVFNMSVGYNYDGITSPKIDSFIEGLKDASQTEIWAECMTWARANLDRFANVDERYLQGVSARVCTSGTLSTLHGCPPAEIERIATHLISVKKLNTFVKCNPTLLGYDFARKTLDDMGYDYVSFDDFHFRDDLQYADAVPMFTRLMRLAGENGVQFGLKLTNTFPVQIKRGELPGDEMYMSGRSLYPLTIELANRITREFDGKLRISFSGGADKYNICDLFDAGIWPITLATTLLKPGGYQRAKQIAEELSAMPYRPFTGVSGGKTAQLAYCARKDARHTKAIKPAPSRKMDQKVPLTSCFVAPCENGCPIHQDIPAYVKLVGEEKYAEALSLILEKNPLPFITGTICPHRCMTRCTREFCDESVHIRDCKLAAAKNGYDDVLQALSPVGKSNVRAAIVGGGPVGMAAAFFLARQGASVTLFEQTDALGGVVRHIIPSFRIADEAIDRDASLLTKLGADVRLHTAAPALDALKAQGYTHILYAIGAWKHGSLRLEKGESMDVFDFLASYKKGALKDVGTDIVIVGGGNTAMDAARAAKRIAGVKHSRIVYRRTRRYMPADEEELAFALGDGVEFCELLAPVSLENGVLTCKKCVLGEPDKSGRRSPVETDELVEIPCSLLVGAVGEKVDGAFLAANGIKLTDRSLAEVDPETLESSVKNVFVIGDAHYGPATVVEGIADARRAADAIVGKHAYNVPESALPTQEACLQKQGVLSQYDCAEKEAGRCLGCSTICECCVQVCPNRANVAIRVRGVSMPQILHIDRMCNECGNCLVFCPYDSAPYLEKFTLFSTEKEFDESRNRGFFPLGNRRVKLRLDSVETVTLGAGEAPAELDALMRTVLDDYAYLIG